MKHRRPRHRCHEAARARHEAKARRLRPDRLRRWKREQAFNAARREQQRQTARRQRNAEIHTIEAPLVLSFLEAPEETARFFADVEARCKEDKNVYLDLSKTLRLTPDAVAVLVSRATETKYNNEMLVFGNLPPEGQAHDVLQHSGATDYFKVIGKAGASDGRGRLVLKKKTRYGVGTDRAPALALVDEAFKRIPGTLYHLDGTQSVFGELLDNTAEHAPGRSGHPERWYASTYADVKTGTLSFTFLDNGQGVFESLERKGLLGVLDRLFGRERPMLLRNLLDRKASESFWQQQSRTGEAHRGRGLPHLKRTLDRKQIAALTIVTNNVIAYVAGDDFRTLGTNFDGTLVYWEYHGTSPLAS